MPGAASLAARQYYAHPRNAFWPIMGCLTGSGPGMPYQERTIKLAQAGVSLWDVLATCQREGSLDTAIRDAQPNDFHSLFQACPHLTHVFFNGRKAEQLFVRDVRPGLEKNLPSRSLIYMGLPSTSPAHAGRTFEEKCRAWQDALEALLL